MHFPLRDREHTHRPKRSAGQIRKISAISSISVTIPEGGNRPSTPLLQLSSWPRKNAFVCIRDFRVIRGFNRQRPAKVLRRVMH
jgi:hypothetical protein